MPKRRNGLTVVTLLAVIGIGGTSILSAFTRWPTLLSVKAILLAFLLAGSMRCLFRILSSQKSFVTRSDRGPPLRIRRARNQA